jgi:Phosphodiester glycosidase
LLGVNSPLRRSAIRSRRRRAPWLAVLATLVVLLGVPVGFYTSAMLQPSSLPLSIRSIEWVRGHGFAWLVNDIERWWYTHHKPRRGGPTLTALPAVGAPRRVHKVAVHWEPAPIVPVIRPRLPGEGRWVPGGVTLGRLSPVLMAVFRPQAAYPRLLAYVAWIDHSLTRLALYPGRYEPPSAAPRGPIQVPFGQRWRLLATFNSGFTHKDGHGGFAVNGATYEPLRPGDATAIAYSDGRVDVRAWTGGPSAGSTVMLARQNLPLLVDRARPSAALARNWEWGSTLGNAVQVWRSALGVDSRGNLIYAAANYQTAASLAQLMIHVGAVRAMELDINAEWPTFIAYGRRGGRDPLKLVPNAQQSASRYLQPDDRDFFAVYARAGGGAAVPFR